MEEGREERGGACANGVNFAVVHFGPSSVPPPPPAGAVERGSLGACVRCGRVRGCAVRARAWVRQRAGERMSSGSKGLTDNNSKTHWKDILIFD